MNPESIEFISMAEHERLLLNAVQNTTEMDMLRRCHEDRTALKQRARECDSALAKARTEAHAMLSQERHVRTRLQAELTQVREALAGSGFDYDEGYGAPIRKLRVVQQQEEQLREAALKVDRALTSLCASIPFQHRTRRWDLCREKLAGPLEALSALLNESDTNDE